MAAARGPRVTWAIGGEGRHAEAWNLNPSAVRTIGRERGQPIPRRIGGRADAIPLADRSVARVVMERCPLTRGALAEIARVVAEGGEIVLRHAMPPGFDPHRVAREVLPGRATERRIRIGEQELQETRFAVGER